MVGKVTGSLSNATFNNQKVLPNLPDPYSVPSQTGLISPDGSSVRIVIAIGGDKQTAHDKLEGIKPVLDGLSKAYPGYNIHTFNPLPG